MAKELSGTFVWIATRKSAKKLIFVWDLGNEAKSRKKQVNQRTKLNYFYIKNGVQKSIFKWCNLYESIKLFLFLDQYEW